MKLSKAVPFLMLMSCGSSEPSYGSDAGHLSNGQNARAETRSIRMYVTGYSYWDNTPPGSLAIARPTIHNQAGGVGTFADPITVAVGHSIKNGRQELDYPAGTRFYFVDLKRYGIVEDVCGDGPRPQDGPCHIGFQGYPWIDLFLGGETQSASEAVRCARKITGVQQVLINPPKGMPTLNGPIIDSGCLVLR